MNDLQATKPHETAPLELDADEIRRLGYRIVDIIADELADPSKRSVYPPPQTPDSMEALFGGPPSRRKAARMPTRSWIWCAITWCPTPSTTPTRA